MNEGRINIPSYLVDEIEEDKNSERVIFTMRGGIKLIAKKSDFQNYEKFKQAVERHKHNRRRPLINK
jgi:hypothetical protein